MEIQFYGANCVRITAKKANLVVDDNLETLGLPSVIKAGDIALFTGPVTNPKAAAKMIIDQPGEFEVSDISIQGIAAQAHMDEVGTKSATIFKIMSEDIRLVVVGHIYPDLSDAQLETIGTVDILVIPVGGHGYTLDPVGALQIIKKIEPKLIIPTHYADKAIKYEVPQISLEEALKELAMEPKETVEKLKLKGVEFSDTTQLIVLERQ